LSDKTRAIGIQIEVFRDLPRNRGTPAQAYGTVLWETPERAPPGVLDI